MYIYQHMLIYIYIYMLYIYIPKNVAMQSLRLIDNNFK